jgi:hypothetical protein
MGRSPSPIAPARSRSSRAPGSKAPQGRRNESKIRRNKIQAGRNKIKMPVPSANRGFSIGYHPFQRPFAGYDICANGPLRRAAPALATTDPFLKSKPELGYWQENVGFPEGAGLLSDRPLDACGRDVRLGRSLVFRPIAKGSRVQLNHVGWTGFDVTRAQFEQASFLAGGGLGGNDRDANLFRPLSGSQREFVRA